VSRASSRGKNTFLDQSIPKFDAVVVVDVEQGDGDAANRSKADQVGTLPAEMLRPFVTTGVEQGCDLARLRVDAGQIRPLERITIVTAQAKIAGDGRPDVLPSHDVVNLEGGVVGRLGYPTVFAATVCTLPD
jgi:hypothetical protein